MAKIKFTLSQHTPLIHFQKNQATLRASELKPKFDRFLKSVISKEKFEKFKIDKEKDALNYKVKIIADVEIKEVKKNTPLFFGVMGGNKKYFSKAKSVEIEFFSFKKELLDIIKDNFEKFLAVSNFGMRQSKGYGSFYLDKKFNKNLIPFRVYSFKSRNWENDISLFYRFLRQGINNTNKKHQKEKFYAKPFIWHYFKEKGITWEKRKIKREFFNTYLQNQERRYGTNSPVGFDSNEYKLVRDLFGLSSNEFWFTYNKARIKKEHPSIERFPSPVTFKVVDEVVYFWANNNMLKEILNKNFKISKGRDSFNISTPNDFNFDLFFNELLEINLKDYVESRYHNTSEFNTLSRILNEIKANR